MISSTHLLQIIVCEDGGVLICCSDCPRSYHRSCIDNNTSTLPLTWTCERCQTDYDVLPHEEIPTDAASADIQSTYSKFVYSEGFEKCCELLTKLSFIVAQLKDADHGEHQIFMQNESHSHKYPNTKSLLLQDISLPSPSIYRLSLSIP